jgi:6-phospho-3-hexuloisomerase
MADFHHLIEMAQQEQRAALAAVDPSQVDRLRQAIYGAQRVFIAGQGRTGLQMQAFAMRLAHMGLSVHVVGSVTAPAIQADDLLVIGSASGHTASLVSHAARAREAGASVALITANGGSGMAGQAICQVVIPAPTPKGENAGAPRSAQPLGSLFEGALGLLLDAVVVQLMDEMGIDEAQMFARHANLE